MGAFCEIRLLFHEYISKIQSGSISLVEISNDYAKEIFCGGLLTFKILQRMETGERKKTFIFVTPGNFTLKIYEK